MDHLLLQSSPRSWPPPPGCTAASRTPTSSVSPSGLPKTPSKSPRCWDRNISVDPLFADRKTLLKTHKDGRLVMEIERKKGDCELPGGACGWLAKKTKWVRVLRRDDQDEKDETRRRRIRRPDPGVNHGRSSSLVGSGMKSKWVRPSRPERENGPAKQGLAKDAAETVMGHRSDKGWRLDDPALPRRRYPGGRQWNRNAAQFVFRLPPWSPTRRRTIRTGT